MQKSVISIPAKDGYQLGATLFTPSGPPTCVIQINSATATRQQFYYAFASYLCEELKALVVTFDYRAIGLSKPKSGLKNFDVAYEDWGKLDLAGVTHYLSKNYPLLPLVYFGHSVGGQMIGLIPELHRVKGMVTVGSTAGYVKFMTPSYRRKSIFFFNFIRPLSNAIFGYGKFKWLGIMEDLPKKLINSWCDWCNVPDYFFDPKYAGDIDGIEGYKLLDTPIKILVAEDDEIATKKNVENFWKHTKNNQNTIIAYLSPSAYGLHEIGHFGFFKRRMKSPLWPLACSELRQILDHEKN